MNKQWKDFLKEAVDFVLATVLCRSMEMLYLLLLYLRLTTGAGFIETLIQLRFGWCDLIVLIGMTALEVWAIRYQRPDLPKLK